MKQTNKKSTASVSYGLGVAKIVAGVPVTFLGLILAIGAGLAIRNFVSKPYGFLLLLLEFGLIAVIFVGVQLIKSGITNLKLVNNYQKIMTWMQYKNRETVQTLAQVTNQSLSELVRDIRLMIKKEIFPNGDIDLLSCEFVIERDGKPAPLLKDGDLILQESVRPSFLPFVVLPITWGIYALFFGFSAWYHFVIAGVISVGFFVLAVVKSKKISTITEKAYKGAPMPTPAPIKTGNTDLDDLLNVAMSYVSQLNELSLSISNPKVSLPIGELLNITRQIFAFVEKQPEKIRQIRQFMNYYLPTTIKLLTSYRELSQQPLKGDNINEAMSKIEGSMDGIVETFRHELDNLYSDKTVDITVDIDVMLAMMRQQGMTDDFQDNKQDEK